MNVYSQRLRCYSQRSCCNSLLSAPVWILMLFRYTCRRATHACAVHLVYVPLQSLCVRWDTGHFRVCDEKRKGYLPHIYIISYVYTGSETETNKARAFVDNNVKSILAAVPARSLVLVVGTNENLSHITMMRHRRRYVCWHLRMFKY